MIVASIVRRFFFHENVVLNVEFPLFRIIRTNTEETYWTATDEFYLLSTFREEIDKGGETETQLSTRSTIHDPRSVKGIMLPGMQ